MWNRQCWALLSEYFRMPMSSETALSTQGELKQPVLKSEVGEQNEIFTHTHSSVKM